ncbi:MAG: hypothetical protein QOI98_1426 [Solirubrobacteraceae bacterium]|nr:hypothetical protein [Solirubrobacteraceae bacterium]
MAAGVAATDVEATPQGPRTTVVLGLVAAPGLPADALPDLQEQLAERLAERYPGVDWEIALEVDPLVSPPAGILDLIEAGRRRLLASEWDMAVCITDLPLRVARRPVAHHASSTHKTGVVSLPALGPVAVQRRLLDTTLKLITDLIGEGDGERRVLAELSSDVGGSATSPVFVARVLAANLRLLAGMVRANRPWRLVVRLYRALVAALAVVAFGVVTRDIWFLGSNVGALRLAIAMVASLAITVVALIVGHDLWERAPSRAAREQVVLFNMATLVTVALGVLALYVALFALSLFGVVLLVTPDLLQTVIHRPATTGDYVSLAWLVSSLATIGGALGAGLESDDAVREAAYGYHAETDEPNGP